MRLLVDTHAALWWMRGDSRLSDRAKDLIRDGRNELLCSIASSWELAFKISTGKLSLGRPLHRFLGDLVGEQSFEVLDVTHEHCAVVSELPVENHRDPFDRMLVAQAQAEDVSILTADAKIGQYDVKTLF